VPGFGPQQAAAGMQQVSLGGPPGPPVSAETDDCGCKQWHLRSWLVTTVQLYSNSCGAQNRWQYVQWRVRMRISTWQRSVFLAAF
jgi:hypothetical protein